jgi:hypothetical protein
VSIAVKYRGYDDRRGRIEVGCGRSPCHVRTVLFATPELRRQTKHITSHTGLLPESNQSNLFAAAVNQSFPRLQIPSTTTTFTTHPSALIGRGANVRFRQACTTFGVCDRESVPARKVVAGCGLQEWIAVAVPDELNCEVLGYFGEVWDDDTLWFRVSE